MNLPSAQLRADRDLWFADWGEAVTYRQVSQTFTPETLTVGETHTDTAITAIVGKAPARPAAGTAGLHASQEVEVVVKTENLPAGEPELSSRIVRDSVEYEIIAFDRSAADLVCTLRCRRR